MSYSRFSVDLGPFDCCVHRFGGNPSHPCVVLIHGSIENARVFYSRSGKGFAPWLAAQGFDVFAIDLPGKGESRPKVSRKFNHSQYQFITTDLPELLKAIQGRNQSGVLHFGAHSWGGVLIAALLARRDIQVRSMVFFGSKRRISIFSLKRLFMVDLIWTTLGTMAAYMIGYLPARAMRIGSDNEPKHFYLQTNRWVYSRKWIDPEDGFDYHAALQKRPLPPTLFLTGIKDDVLGHPRDVELLMNEMHSPGHEFRILGKAFGNARDYGHIDLLTYRNAAEDHFPEVLRWFRESGGIS